MKIKIALAQFTPSLGDVNANLKTILDFIAQAQAQHVDLIVLPELALTGYYLKDLVPNVAVSPTMADPAFAPMLEASRNIDIAFGFVEQDARYRYYISAAYLSQGRVVHIHRKVYLPTYRLFDDARFFAPGTSFRAFNTRFGRMGILICEDAWHISSPYVLWQDGADFLIDISASPGYGISTNDLVANATTVTGFLKTYAEMLTTFVIFSNRTGMEDGIAFWGGSCVLGPDGKTLATMSQFEQALTCVEIDTDALRRARISLPILRDEESELVRHELGRVAKRELDK
ncbi:MAG: carbon-nitrogen hydrolase [Chloroflexi bacterium]|nr:carbon-nitrogen hydrolase [Chloroflexota bacterium]